MSILGTPASTASAAVRELVGESASLPAGERVVMASSAAGVSQHRFRAGGIRTPGRWLVGRLRPLACFIDWGIRGSARETEARRRACQWIVVVPLQAVSGLVEPVASSRTENELDIAWRSAWWREAMAVDAGAWVVIHPS